MAITVQLGNSNPHTAYGITSNQDITVVERKSLIDVIPKAFDLNLHECAYVETAFAETGGVINDDYKNDKTDLLFGLSIPTDTVTLKLYKKQNGKGVLKATITDNTYGVYWPSSAFPDQLKIGFVADWNLIMDAFGAGMYYFTADRTIINQLNTLTSHLFYLKIYRDEDADGTVKVRTVNTGIIEGGIDYTGFEWISYIRVYGFFGKPSYEYMVENYITSTRTIEQIQTKVRTTYLLELRLHPDSVIDPLVKDRFLGNEIYITAYGIFDFLQTKLYKEIPVADPGVEDQEYFEVNSKAVHSFTFTDKVQTPIKRRY